MSIEEILSTLLKLMVVSIHENGYSILDEKIVLASKLRRLSRNYVKCKGLDCSLGKR